MNLDFSLDQAIIDDKRAVTFFQRTAPGLPKPTTGGIACNAWRTAPDEKVQTTSQGSITETTTNWHVWAADLGAVVPKTGDRLVDEVGAGWAVGEVQRMDEGARFRLTCTREK